MIDLHLFHLPVKGGLVDSELTGRLGAVSLILLQGFLDKPDFHLLYGCPGFRLEAYAITFT